MGGCCTAANTKEKGDRKSKSADQPINKAKNDLKVSRDGKNPQGISKYNQGKKETPDQGNEGRPMMSNRSNKSAQGSQKRGHQRSSSLKKGGDTNEAQPTDQKDKSEIPPISQLKKKTIPTFDISPKIVRQFRIYNVQSHSPIQVPYSKHQEWQQVLNLYQQKLNMASFQTNLGNGSFRNRKSIEIENHLAQVQMHREIELMEKILNMRNRNWVREQIKMCRRLAAMQPGSFDSLVVTREYLQLKEHFNWLVWAVGFYYFQMSKIEQFFQYCQQRQAKSASQAAGGESKQGGQSTQRAKLQSQHYQDIARLMEQIKGLKTKLPSPISKKWTEGFNFQGIFVRMLPYSDSYFVRNEIKALKYMQNELMELSQLQNQLGDLAAAGSFAGQQQPQPSMYKSLILPLLGAVECGGFLIFASPTIHIEDYDDDSHLFQEQEEVGVQSGYKGSKTPRGPKGEAPDAMGPSGETRGNARGPGGKHSSLRQPWLGNAEQEFAEQQRRSQMGERRRALTSLYGTGVHQNRKTMMRKLQNKQKERSYSFLQENIDEIEDPLLKKMPLLRNLTKENLIPIIDFEDPTQVDLNYLLLHVYDCLPCVGRQSSEYATAVLRLPSDPSAEVSFINGDLNVSSASVADIQRALRAKAGGGRQGQKEERKGRKGDKRRGVGEATPTRDQGNPFSYPSQLKTPQQVFKNEGGDHNDFSDESSLVCESDFERPGGDPALDDPTELFDAKCFTKHGFDLLLISNNIPNLLALQKLQGPASKKDQAEAAGSGVGAVGSEHQGTSHLVANKRAQALFAAREEESHYSGLFRKNQSPYLGSVVQFQASLVENAAASGGFVVGAGKATHAVGQSLVRSPASSKKQSILRKVNSTGFSYGYGGGGMAGFDSGSGVPGISSMFGPDASEQQQLASDGASIQGNALIIAQSSASEFKLKYPLINHSHDPSLEQIFLSSLDHIARIMDTTDTVYNVQSLKDLFHRKGLNLRFEWILLSKLRQNQGRQLVMIHILVRVMKRIINEEMKLKAQVFAPSKPKPLNLAAPKSLADHQKQSLEQARQATGDSRRPSDHFIGNHYETFKDTLVFFSNTLLRRKFSKQKHVFDETLIGLFLNRLKAFPILNAMINFNQNAQSGPSLVKDYEANYIKSKNILEDIISAPSQNPALYLNALQHYFDVDIDQEFLRRCRQDKCAFLSQLTSQPMVLNNIQNVNLRNHTYYSLKEYAYFMLANQISKSRAEEKRDQARLSQLDGESRASVLTANQNLRSNIFRNQFQQKVSRNTNEDLLNSSMRSTQSIRGATGQASHQVFDDANSVASEQKMQRQNIMNQNGRGNPIGPMGGAPGRRESLAQFAGQPGQVQLQNDILNSSTITDRNKARLHGGIAGHPLEIAQLGDQSVVSRSSALASQVVNVTRGGYPRDGGANLARANQQLGPHAERQTPRQFNNIDGFDFRNQGLPLTHDFPRDLQRQSPQILGIEKLKTSGGMSNQPAPNLRPQGSELVMPPILYKLICRWPGDAGFDEYRGQATSNLLPYYFMPSQHVFNTWVMYLESILQEVHSVEGSEQILLEALNFLALNIYFDGQKEAASGIGSPGSPMSPELQRDQLSSQRFGAKQSNVGSDDFQGIFDRDQFVKVCAKIKEVQAFTSKCSPEVLAVSQIMCGLNFELALDDSLFPIESEKSYLTALICLFQTIGDPRGRGNHSIPFMLLITWKLSLMSLSIENRKVHDAEFSEELFDATLSNLSNHQMLFRSHQNDKLNRVIVQQDKLDQQNLLSALNKESAIEQKRKPGGGGNTFNSRRSNHNGNLKDTMYKITTFEEKMDRESRKKERFDVKKYKNSNIASFGQVTEKSSGRWELNKKVPGHPLTTQQTPRASNQPHGGALNNMQSLQQSQVVYAGGFKSIAAKAENAGKTGINVSQSYQGHAGGFKSILTQSAAPQLNAQGPGTKASKGFGAQIGAQGPSHANIGTAVPTMKLGIPESNRVSRLSVQPSAQQQRQLQNQKDLHSLLEANISDIDLDFGEDQDEETENNSRLLGPSGPIQQIGGMMYEFALTNYSDDSLSNPEVPFPHWSIYRQSVQNLLIQQGHKFQRNVKQLNKFLSQMYRNVLFTAVDKKILYPWFVKYNPMMYQSGQQWKNNQIKQAVFFQSAQMVSSRSSSKSFQKNESEYSLSLSMQGSLISQGGQQSFRTGSKTQNLGSYSSIINTENGSINKGDMHGVLYSWGSDGQGQLGHDSFAHLTLRPVSQKILYPRMISVLKDEFIKDVCCGYAHTHAITNGGLIYSWGNNESGQLGLGPEAPQVVRKPKLIENLRNIVKLSAGNEHSAAINKNQELFTWGSMYQTGQDDRENRTVPKKVEALANVRIHQVSCGGLHTLALSKDNKIYCWGSTEGGQLGLPTDMIQKLCKNEENAVTRPQLLASLQEQQVIQAGCGETHSICLCKDGSIYGWGLSLYGQLGLGFSSDSFEPGLGQEKSKVPEPRRIETLKDEQVVKIFCGSTFSLFLTKTGELYGCGMNDLGQLGEDAFNDLSALENARMGQSQTSDVTIPTQVSSLQGIQLNSVACGEAHVLAVDGDGKDARNMLWAWGQHKNGQLGLGEVNAKLNPRPIQSLASGKIQRIAAGSSHSLAVLGDAADVTTLSSNFYAGNEVLSNSWSVTGLIVTNNS